MLDEKKYDLIVLGATGFAGKSVTEILARMRKENTLDVSWTIAGRSREKLCKLLEEINSLGYETDNVDIIECDIQNAVALTKVAESAQVLINCTGPNSVLSAPIVQACVTAGTHYVDISAEIYHILKLYQDYNKAAEVANVLVVPSCGYSAMVAEAALIHLQRLFEGTLRSVACYIEIDVPKKAYFPGLAGALVHSGTWTSLVYVLENFKRHLELKKQLFPPIEDKPEDVNKNFFHRHGGQSWVPYPGTENDVVDISQRYLNETKQNNYVHFKSFVTFPLCIHFLLVPALYLYYYLCYFKCFRKLMIRYPRVFSLCMMSDKGPSKKMRDATKYSFVLNGRGWGKDDDVKSTPTKSLSIKVSGSDPGYYTTAMGIVMAAITILKERHNMPKGGVLMPGAAFKNTDIFNRLSPSTFKCEVIEPKS